MDISIENSDGVCRIAFARPAHRNTLSSAMLTEAADAIEAACEDSGIGAIVISGDSQTFSGGQDLEEMRRGDTEAAQRLVDVIENSTKPVIAAVNGPAVGLACVIVMACDFAYAGSHAFFSLPYTALGLTPEFGATLLTVSCAGASKAAEKILLSEPISAAEAFEMRMVAQVLDDDKVLGYAVAKAQRLAKLAPDAVATSRRLLRQARRCPPAELNAAERAAAAGRASGPEASEAFAAFQEGRRPEFRRG